MREHDAGSGTSTGRDDAPAPGVAAGASYEAGQDTRNFAVSEEPPSWPEPW